MLDEPFRRLMARSAAAPARAMARLGITPNQVTVAALALALAAAVLTGSGEVRVGITIWIASRVLDGYDGILARLGNGPSLFGGFLDITADMLAYSAMAIGFALAFPDDRVLWLVVIAGYVMAISTTLALSSLLERADRQLGGNRSLQFTPAPAEGGETTIVYTIIALWPASSHVVLAVWIALLTTTMILRTRLAFRLLR